MRNTIIFLCLFFCEAMFLTAENLTSLAIYIKSDSAIYSVTEIDSITFDPGQENYSLSVIGSTGKSINGHVLSDIKKIMFDVDYLYIYLVNGTAEQIKMYDVHGFTFITGTPVTEINADDSGSFVVVSADRKSLVVYTGSSNTQKVTMYTLDGKVCYTNNNMSDGGDINLSGFKTGWYMVKIGMHTQKIYIHP
jgi:hypothetical protein